MTASVEIALLALLSAAVAGLLISRVLRLRRRTVDRELRRRLSVHRHGRFGDGTVTDAAGDVLYYDYRVGGMQYTAAQDLSGFRDRLPRDPSRLIGRPVTLKYTPRNPANSIVVCEYWSGLPASNGKGDPENTCNP